MKKIKRKELLKQDPNLPPALIVDIDGTLAHSNEKRGIFDWNNVHLDETDDVIIHISNSYYIRDGYKIIMVTGRDEICRDLTEQWLKDNGICFDALYMRSKGSREKDIVIKKTIFEKHIKDKYNIKFVLEDRSRVVDMWRNDIGLKCLQVQDGD